MNQDEIIKLKQTLYNLLKSLANAAEKCDIKEFKELSDKFTSLFETLFGKKTPKENEGWGWDLARNYMGYVIQYRNFYAHKSVMKEEAEGKIKEYNTKFLKQLEIIKKFSKTGIIYDQRKIELHRILKNLYSIAAKEDRAKYLQLVSIYNKKLVDIFGTKILSNSEIFDWDYARNELDAVFSTISMINEVKQRNKKDLVEKFKIKKDEFLKAASIKIKELQKYLP